MDIYGFPYDDDEAAGPSSPSSSAAAAARAACAAAAARRAPRWSAVAPGGPLPPRDELKALARKGVPPHLRPWVWAAASGAAAAARSHGRDYYPAIVAMGEAQCETAARQVDLDLPRTFPANPAMEGVGPALRRVLLGFAAHAPDVGYCQSMNYVAALLLLVCSRGEVVDLHGDGVAAPPPSPPRSPAKAGGGGGGGRAAAALARLASRVGGPGPSTSPAAAGPAPPPPPPPPGPPPPPSPAAEEAAFWLLTALAGEGGILYQGLYGSDLAGAHVELRSLGALATAKLPRLAAHLHRLGVDMSLLALDWLLCLFATSLPAPTAVRVWDALFVEGPKVLFRVGLALLRRCQAGLLAAASPADALACARSAGRAAWDADALLKTAFDGLGSLPMARLASLRAGKQAAVDAELAARAAGRRAAAAKRAAAAAAAAGRRGGGGGGGGGA